VIKKGKKHMMAGEQDEDLGTATQKKGEHWHRKRKTKRYISSLGGTSKTRRSIALTCCHQSQGQSLTARCTVHQYVEMSFEVTRSGVFPICEI